MKNITFSNHRITNLTKLSTISFLSSRARESRKFLEASRVEAHNSEGEVQLNSTGPREMAGVSKALCTPFCPPQLHLFPPSFHPDPG